MNTLLARGFLAALVVLTAVATANARNEAAVGQCGLTFVNTGDSCEKAFGGAGADPPDGDKLNACWDKASAAYNQCMDKALAAPSAAIPGNGTVNPKLSPKNFTGGLAVPLKSRP
jgi:hypothetical protein